MQVGGVTQALDWLERNHPLLIDDLGRLVAVETSFPPGAGYGAFADLLESLVEPLGFACERVTVPADLYASTGVSGERVNLIAARDGSAPPLAIYFHTDTVPPGEGWSSPPFALTSRDGTHYGRGTADMKGAIACVLAALKAAEAAGLPLAYRPSLLFCTDEEGGLYPGIRWLAESGKLAPGAHLINLNGGAVPRIWAGCFGSLDLRVRFFGRSAHSGDQVDGVNALEQALPALNALIALKAEVEQRVSALPAPPHVVDGKLRARLSLTAAQGGAKGSALPGRFEIVVNRRYMPEEEADDVLAEIEDCLAEAVDKSTLLGHEIETVGHLAPVRDPRGPHWPRWQSALAEGFGWPPEDFRAYGASTSSDMGWIQPAGIQEILLGGLARPDRNVHAADEHTTDEDLKGLARSVLLYLSRDFAPEQCGP